MSDFVDIVVERIAQYLKMLKKCIDGTKNSLSGMCADKITFFLKVKMCQNVFGISLVHTRLQEANNFDMTFEFP